MKSIFTVVSAAAASFGMISVASAADMTGSEIEAFISGKTLYLETTAASVSGLAGQAQMFNAQDGAVIYRQPDGVMLHGKWSIKGDTFCVEWKEVPDRNDCRRYGKNGSDVSVLDGNGQLRAKVLKTAPGNAENLK